LGGIHSNLAPLQVAKYFAQRLNYAGGILVRNYAELCQHAAMRDTPLDIIPVEPAVEIDGSCVFFHQLVCGLVKASLPKLLGQTKLLKQINWSYRSYLSYRACMSLASQFI